MPTQAPPAPDASSGHPRRSLGVPQALIVAPALVALGIYVTWTESHGGFYPTAWYPGAIALLGLLATTVLIRGPHAFRGLSKPALWAIGLLGAFAIWNFVSISWADVKGDAWDGANRTLLYLSVFALFALLPWRTRPAAAALGVFALATATVGAIELLQAGHSDIPEAYFLGGQFDQPIGYSNGNAALWLVAFWPALFLSSRRETPWPLRGLFLGAAGILFELAILPQSRGMLFAFPIVALLYLGMVPGRVRSLGSILMLGGALLVWGGSVFDLWTLINSGGDIRAPLADATAAMRYSFLALLVAGTAVGYIDHRLRLSAGAARAARRAVGASSLAAGAAALALLLSVIGNPADWVSTRWHEFTNVEAAQASPTRFSSGLGGTRYDYWRVGMRILKDSPLTGVGSDNFAVDYLQRRTSPEQPLYPHSLEIRILVGTGLVGAILFAGFLVAASAAARPALQRTQPRFAAGVAATAIVTFTYWLVHGSGDWFWELPALGIAAFACLGMAAGLGRRSALENGAGRTVPPPITAPSRALAAAVVVVGTIVAVSYWLPWRAAENIESAKAAWVAGDSREALDKLQRARRLNFLSDKPDLIAAAVNERMGNLNEARLDYFRTLARNPEGWYPQLQLGILDSLRDERSGALRHVRRAKALNPRDPVVTTVLTRLEAGRPVSLEQVRRLLLLEIAPLLR